MKITIIYNRVRKYLHLLAPILIFQLTACRNLGDSVNSISMITDPVMQDSLFTTLVGFTNKTINEHELNDSLAFLVLPVDASCPSCRKKTIDSILKHKNNLPKHHYIIISAGGGRKTINSYFREQRAELPDIKNKLFLDSTHQAMKFELFKNNTSLYYTYNRKAFKKVEAIPATVRDDLQEFFSGTRRKEPIAKK